MKRSKGVADYGDGFAYAALGIVVRLILVVIFADLYQGTCCHGVGAADGLALQLQRALNLPADVLCDVRRIECHARYRIGVRMGLRHGGRLHHRVVVARCCRGGGYFVQEGAIVSASGGDG